MEESLLLKIRSYYPSLTKTEKKISDVVLKKSDEIIYYSITELAEECEVSETSVIRLCRRIGLSGYQEFKVLLAKESGPHGKDVYEGMESINDLTSLAKRLAEENILSISDTMRVFSPLAMEKAADAIINAKRMEIYGVGASGFTAMDAMYKFKRIGKMADAYSDAHMQAISAVMLSEGDVALGISFTGSARDTVDALGLAKKAGAFTICITNYAKSPIVKHADVVILTSVRGTPLLSGSLVSKVAQHHVLDLLYSAVVLKTREIAQSNIDKTSEAVTNMLYK